jgi:ketosteroid isomerase-like protein
MASRNVFWCIPLLFACARSTTTASPGASPGGTGENNEAARQQLSRLEDDWAKAYEAHDTTFFVRALAPDFHGTADSANTFGKADAVRNAADTATVQSGLQDRDRQIRIYGNGTVGVVTGQSIWTVDRGEHPGRYSGRYTEVFVKQPNGQWQAVAGHYSIGTSNEQK